MSKTFDDCREDRAGTIAPGRVDLNPAAFVEDDLSAWIRALSDHRVTFVELTGEDQDSGEEFGLLRSSRPAMLPGLDAEWFVWRR
ncbi:hypothetical protein [Kibdelosporangium aridum]|uniref:hypothetical protein n=1 Tax=Kibdelosporangium aridum TaxID=2030 RepID=UPI0005240C75